MKVLSFGHIPSWAGGQQETGLANVIYQLAKHESYIDGADVTLAATDVYIPQKYDGNLRILGWTKWILAVEMTNHPINTIKTFIKLVSLKRKYPMNERIIGLFLKRIFFRYAFGKSAPDVVHLHSPSAIWFLDLLPRTSKTVVTFHGLCGLDNNINQYDVLYNMEHDIFHSPQVSQIFFICSRLVKDFESAYGKNGKRNSVIFNSYDDSQFYFHKEEAEAPLSAKRILKDKDIITLCTVATLSERKGQMRVLSALASLPVHNIFKYVCIGSGERKNTEKLKEFASINNINFEYLGKVKPKDIRKQLYKADYMIMPSSSEGFGLTYLEAIACGVPVILPKDIPIAQEKDLINKNNSILLDDCSPDAIAKVLTNLKEKFFNHEDVANTITGISWDMIARQYYNEFEKI